MEQANPFKSIEKELEVGGQKLKYFSLPDLGD